MNKQPPPHKLEYEQTVLGGILFRPKLFPQVAESLDHKAFYRADHEIIFRAMQAACEEGRLPDAVAVHQYLREYHPSEGITALFLFELSENVGTTANLPWYFDRLRELGDKRKPLQLWEPIGQRLKTGGNPGPIIADLADFVRPADRDFPPLNGKETPLSELLKNPIPPATISWTTSCRPALWAKWWPGAVRVRAVSTSRSAFLGLWEEQSVP